MCIKTRTLKGLRLHQFHLERQQVFHLPSVFPVSIILPSVSKCFILSPGLIVPIPPYDCLINLVYRIHLLVQISGILNDRTEVYFILLTNQCCFCLDNFFIFPHPKRTCVWMFVLLSVPFADRIVHHSCSSVHKPQAGTNTMTLWVWIVRISVAHASLKIVREMWFVTKQDSMCECLNKWP